MDNFDTVVHSTYPWNNREIRDLYKYAHGFRPTESWVGEWICMSADQRQETWDRLLTIMRDMH